MVPDRQFAERPRSPEIDDDVAQARRLTRPGTRAARERQAVLPIAGYLMLAVHNLPRKGATAPTLARL